MLFCCILVKIDCFIRRNEGSSKSFVWTKRNLQFVLRIYRHLGNGFYLQGQSHLSLIQRIGLQIKATLDNVTNLKPEGIDFRWYLKVSRFDTFSKKHISNLKNYVKIICLSEVSAVLKKFHWDSMAYGEINYETHIIMHTSNLKTWSLNQVKCSKLEISNLFFWFMS